MGYKNKEIEIEKTDGKNTEILEVTGKIGKEKIRIILTYWATVKKQEDIKQNETIKKKK